MIEKVEDLEKGEIPINKIVLGDIIPVLEKLPSNSVDCLVTSPPYWSKRVYSEETIKKWSDGWEGQLGLEPTPFMFVEHLAEIFTEIKRVMKPEGNIFINIDDTWAGSGSWSSTGGVPQSEESTAWKRKWAENVSSVPPARDFKEAQRKSLCLVPELFAIKMVYGLGYVLREKIAWCKKFWLLKEKETVGTTMPTSAKDRLTHSWEYVFHFTLQPDYFFDLDNIRLPHKLASIKRAKYPMAKFGGNPKGGRLNKGAITPGTQMTVIEINPEGISPPDVLYILASVTTRKIEHFALMPIKLAELLIEAGCPGGGIVLDPFAGACTTGIAARKHERNFIMVDISREYCEIGEKRLSPLMKQKHLTEF